MPKMKVNSKLADAADASRDAEATKTARLRALRLAKEAADKEVAAREAAASALRPRARRAPRVLQTPVPSAPVAS